MENKKLEIEIEVNTEQLEKAIEKANQLNELLKSAKQIADLLHGELESKLS